MWGWLLFLVALLGNFGVAYANPWGWFVWIVSNIGWCTYHVYHHDWPSLGMFTAFFFTACWGLHKEVQRKNHAATILGRFRFYLRWWKAQLWLPKDEFHPSLVTDHEVYLQLSEQEQAIYHQDLTDRRRRAHIKDLMKDMPHPITKEDIDQLHKELLAHPDVDESLEAMRILAQEPTIGESKEKT